MRRIVSIYALIRVYCFAAMLHLVCTASAQQSYSIVHYDETKLPQTSIGSIQQDKDDYLWMNSQYGIIRFDGTVFRTFNMDNLKGLLSNRIRLCAKSEEGAIYFVDENHTILKVTAPNRFETIATDTAIAQGVLPLYASESNSDIVLLPMGKGFQYDHFTDALQMDKLREISQVFTTGVNKGCFFYLDLQGRHRPCYFNGTHYRAEVVSNALQPQHTFKLNNQIFWQATASEAYLLQEGLPMQKVKVTGLPAPYTDVFKQSDRAVFYNSTGTYLYASGNLYQYQYLDGAIKATLLFNNLPCSGVTNVTKEKTTGDYFISTKSEGFYQVKIKRFGVINLVQAAKNNLGQPTPVNNNIVYALHFWDQQHLFAFCNITPIHGSNIVRSLPFIDYTNFNLYFLYKPDSTHIWVDNKGWLQSIDLQNRSTTPLFPVFNARKAVPLSDGTTVLVASHKIIAINNGVPTDWYNNDAMNFTTIERLSDSCFVVGSQNGLFYFYPAQKKLQRLPYEKELKIRSLLRDHAGKMWFTTYGQGLFFLSGNRIVPLHMDNNQYLAISHSMVQDRTGNFWVSTNHGLFKLKYNSLLDIIGGKSDKLYYTYFDKTDGFNTNEFNGGCSPSGIYQPGAGWMFFPSMNGIVKFQPDSIKSISNNTPIYFDEAISNDTVHIYALTKESAFDKNTSSLRFLFSSPYFGNTANIKYSYALSTAPNDWKEIDNSGSIALNNLPGGSYTLRIKKEEAASKPVITAIPFEIEKKFSETIWFKLLVLIAVIGLVFLYFRARLFYLQQERTRLECEVSARTADQRRLIVDLKNTVTELQQVQRELSQMIEHRESIMGVLIHDIKSPLRFLNTVAAHLATTLQQNAAVKNKTIASEIAASLNQLYLFVQDFALWLSASTPGRLQQNERTNLQQLFAEIVAVYSEGAMRKGINIQQSLATTTVYGDPAMMKSVLRNLLDNAIKNTSDGHIFISAGCTYTVQECEITIKDEGKGLPQEQVAELNQYFAGELEELSFSSERSGHKIIKDFLQKLHGRIYYQQTDPHGLTVTVTLPAEPLDKNIAGKTETSLSNSN